MKNHLTYKVLFTAALTSAVLVSTVPQVHAITFKDVDALGTSTYDIEVKNAIYNLANRKVINGVGNDLFAPNQNIRRSEAAKIIALAKNINTTNVANPNFSDVKTTDWYYPYVAALANLKIINGYNGKFNPDSYITRPEMAKIIALAYGLEAKSSSSQHPFKDIPAGNFSHEYVAALYDNEVTKGTDATNFGFNANVTRAQLAVFTIRAEKVKNNGSETPTNVGKTISLQPSQYGFTSFNAPTTDGSNIYKASLTNGTVQISALNEGQGKILLSGSSTSNGDAFYLVNVEKLNGELKVALEKANLLEYIDYSSSYFQYQDLGIGFKPAIASLKKNGTADDQNLSIQLDEKGFDITIFGTGSYTLTLENGQASKTLTIDVKLKNFATIIDVLQ